MVAGAFALNFLHFECIYLFNRIFITHLKSNQSTTHRSQQSPSNQNTPPHTPIQEFKA